MFLYLVRPESSRIFCCKVYKWIGVVFRWFYFPGVFCESVVFTEVWRRSCSVGGSRDYSSVTEVTSKVLAEAVLIEVTERLRGYLARGRVYTGVTEGQVLSYKPWVSLCEVLRGITAFVWNKYSGCVFRHPCVLIRQQTTYHFKHRTRNSYYLKLKIAISRFVFQIFYVNKLWWFVSSSLCSKRFRGVGEQRKTKEQYFAPSALTEFTPMWKTSVKLPFVTKNSKHLVRLSDDDSSVLFEFTPL